MDIVAQIAMSKMPPVARLMVEQMGQMLEAYEGRVNSEGQPQQTTPKAGKKGESPETAPQMLTMAMIRQFYLPINERTLDRWITAGQFPKADLSMGGKIRWWRRETVERWLEERCQNQ